MGSARRHAPAHAAIRSATHTRARLAAMPFRQALLAEFDHEMAATRRLLSCIPEHALGWRPHAKSRSVAELAAHLTDITRWSLLILDLNRFDLDAVPAGMGTPETTAMLLQQFGDNVNE